MPRRARLALADTPWHIIQRGNNRSPCFYVEEDYRQYLDILHKQAQKHGCMIHAYVLMTNHVHLLLTPTRQESAARLMKHLGQRYVQHINRTYCRSGTIWDGRFRSCLTQDDEYILGCYRYIELNPVRAAMVEHPRDYPWSSFRSNGDGETNPLITPHPDYLRLGPTEDVRRDRYRTLFSTDIKPELLSEIRLATNGGYVLGTQRFKDKVAELLGRRVVPGRSGRPLSGKRQS